MAKLINADTLDGFAFYFEDSYGGTHWVVDLDDIKKAPTIDTAEIPCRCCDCYYLLNGKNSFGLYFFCGHENGLKNLKNTEKDFCPYGKVRYEDG